MDLDQFVKIMSEVLKDHVISDRIDFISELVDIFYRIKPDDVSTIKFEDLTTFLIDHEIAFDADRGGTSGGYNATNSSGMNMEYEEAKHLRDTKAHNAYIEKIYYFQEIDRMVLFERDMKHLRIYDGLTMRHETDINCNSVILAVEFIPDKNAICVSLSDRTFIFYSAKPKDYVRLRKFNLKFIQKNLCYVKRKRVMFSAQTDCTVNAWDIEEIFARSEFEYGENEEAKKKKMMEAEKKNKDQVENKEIDYIKYLTDSTPWFISKHSSATCIVDLPNIEHIAFGTQYKVIELWELRNGEIIDEKKRRNNKMITDNSQVKAKNAAKDMTAKFKSIKRLSGHTKGIREIAYSKAHKILISVGFDFQVLVWNPYQ